MENVDGEMLITELRQGMELAIVVAKTCKKLCIKCEEDKQSVWNNLFQKGVKRHTVTVQDPES